LLQLLRKLYINEGTVVQLRTELETSTSWETVDNLKTQNEAMILQLKNVHESELRKLYEQNRRENNCLESQTRQLKEDLESVKEKLHASEAAKTLLQESLTALQKENASNVRFVFLNFLRKIAELLLFL
jgi:predicted nuclease with TOPRIM domain